MAMTKRDYEMVAKVLRTSQEYMKERYGAGRSCVVDDVSLALANRFTENNPRFNKGQFLEAAGSSVLASMRSDG